jgi:phytoene dehydrogenase-like protein
VLLMHMAGGWMPTFVRGGLGAFSAALASAARSAGADIRISAPVARIDVQNGRVSGVTTKSGEQFAARVVVSNADPRHTLLV